MTRRSVLVSRRRPRAETKRAFSAPRTSCGPAVAEVAREPVRRFLTQRHDAFLGSLAQYVDGLLLEVHVREIELHRLLAAQAGRVDELAERAIA